MLEKPITSDTRLDSGLFGFNTDVSDSTFVIVPAEWETTVSYHSGTSLAPSAIELASNQCDLGQFKKDLSSYGMTFFDSSSEWTIKHNILREKARLLIKYLDSGGVIDTKDQYYREMMQVNEGCAAYINYLESVITGLLNQNKCVGFEDIKKIISCPKKEYLLINTMEALLIHAADHFQYQPQM